MANDEHRPVVLVVLDGWGYRERARGQRDRMARVPTWDRLWSRAPRTLLDASGLAVGLPEGQMGNSEVGHLNLGAGRVVMQDLVRIDLADSRRLVLPASRVPRRVRPRARDRRDAPPDGSHRRRRRSRDRPAPVRAVRPRRARAGAAHRAFTHCSTAATRCQSPRSATCSRRSRELRTDGPWSRASVGATTGWIATSGGSARSSGTTPPCSGIGPQVDDPVAAIRAAYDRGETDEFIKPMVVARERRAGRAVPRRRCADLLQLPVGPNAADRSRADRSSVRRIPDVASEDSGRDDDVVRPDVHRAGRVPAAVDGADRRRDAGRAWPHVAYERRKPRSTRT